MESLQRLLALAVLVVLVSTLGVSQVYALDPGYSLYESPDMGLSVEYPTGTFVDDSQLGVVLFYAPLDDGDDFFNENIMVAIENLFIPMTLEEYFDLSVENLEFEGISVTASKSTTLDNNPAKEITVSMNIEGQIIEQTQIFSIKDKTAYIIAITTLPETTLRYMPTFDRLVDSFEFLEVSDTPVEIEQFPISQYLSYEDPEKGLTIKYPPNWQKTELESAGIDVIFQSPLESISDVFAENSLLVTEKISGLSLEDYSKISINKFETRPTGVVITEESSTMLAGLPAHQIIYTETGELGIETTAWMVWTIANDSAYIVGFGSTPDAFYTYEPIFQNMLDSVVIEELDLPTPVSGTYSNSDIGLEIELPEGWEGIEQKKEDLTMMVASSGITMQPFAQGSQVSDKLDFSIITIIMGKYSAIKEEISSAVSEDTECTSQTVQVINLNNMKTQESEADCEDPMMGTIKGLEYTFATKDDAIVVIYGAISKNPDKKFDENIEQFNESLKTLTIQNTLDISDPFVYANTLDMTASKESVMVDGQNLDVLFASNSDISNVSFDEQTNSLTFDHKGSSGELGMTEVYLGGVLEEPYSVSLGTKQIDDFVVVHDTTNGQTSVFFEYENPTGLVTITNQVKATEIPDWVRGNAEWWAQGAIGDSDFVSGIQYLIKEGIMSIPETATPTSGGDSKEIPSWIKNNADWWAQGLISDDDFVKGIQFLIQNGIMEV